MGVPPLPYVRAQLTAEGAVADYTSPSKDDAAAVGALSEALFHGALENSFDARAAARGGCTLCLVKPHLVRQKRMAPLVAELSDAGFEVVGREDDGVPCQDRRSRG